MHLRPWLPLLPLCLVLAACDDEKDDTHGGDDSDADTDVDTDADVDACEGENVLDSTTGVCWRRCPLGAMWVPEGKGLGHCKGTATTMGYQAAQDACRALGENWMLPPYGNVTYLLGPCDKEALAGEAGQCAACTDACKATALAENCTLLFGSDASTYWSLTPYAGAKGEHLAADFCTGLTAHYPDDPTPETIAARCVRPAPPPEE